MKEAASPLPMLTLAAALVPAIPVQAQEMTSEPIIVRGTRDDPAVARARALEFVKRTGVAGGQQQIARWIVPTCVKVIGLTDVQTARVQAIIQGIGRGANIPTAAVGCRPNITISFAHDAGQVVRAIHARQPRQFRELSTTEREQLLNGTAAVRWWYSTQILDSNGMQSNGTTVHIVAAGGEEHISSLPSGSGATITQQHNGGSNLRTPTVRAIHRANVVVDAQQAGKISVDALAAYAAMVAFAELDASDPPPPDSVLGLFQADSLKTSLTDWDLAFLRSLYRMPLDRRSRIQRGHLVEALLDERLPKEGATKKP